MADTANACLYDGAVHPIMKNWPCYQTNANPQEPAVTKGSFPSGTAAEVMTFPTCDICVHVEHRDVPRLALYDGATHVGQWANMCPAHFVTHGRGLGLGKGQRLVLVREAVAS